MTFSEKGNIMALIEKDILIQLYQKEQKNASEIAKILKIGRTSVLNYLKKYKITKHRHRKYIANDNFFKIWSYDMAYILGFITADGHVAKENPYIIIALQTRDRTILEYIRDNLSPSSKIKENKDKTNIRLYILSEEIVNDFKKFNITYDKTFNLKINFEIPDEFFGSYLLGFFDGDGSIYSTKMRNTQYYYSSFSCASKQFLVDIHNKINIGIVKSVRKKYYELKICQSECLKLYEIMYKHQPSCCLDRKRNKFLLISSNYKKWTIEDDKIIIDNLDKRPEEIHKLLPNRSIDAIRVRKNNYIKNEKF